MSVIGKLASSLGRKDEVPNQELAKKIVDSADEQAVKELVELLVHKNKDIQSDCIKVIYEIGSLKPELISEYSDVFVTLLDQGNNRMQWGAMTALSAIAGNVPDKVYKSLPAIISAADKGSVITNDHCVAILIKLCAYKKHQDTAFTLLIERLLKCPTNQLPMYAENALKIITGVNRKRFTATLTKRIPEIEKESKRRRVEAVIKKALKD